MAHTRIAEKEFGRLMDRVMAPWAVSVTEDMAEVYFDSLSDIDARWLSVGADHICRYRLRNEGFPTPGDWRVAAEQSMRQAVGHSGPIHGKEVAEWATREQASAAIDEMRRKLKDARR